MCDAANAKWTIGNTALLMALHISADLETV